MCGQIYVARRVPFQCDKVSCTGSREHHNSFCRVLILLGSFRRHQAPAQLLVLRKLMAFPPKHYAGNV